MTTYLIRRLLLLPFTVFCILLLNFFIINLAPGDPSSTTEISDSGEANKSEEHTASHSLSDPYFYFREFYGLTLPIFFNTWPWISYEEVLSNLHQLLQEKDLYTAITYHDYQQLKLLVGDQAPYTLPHLFQIAQDTSLHLDIRHLATHYFIRGGRQVGVLGPSLSKKEKENNRAIAKSNELLNHISLSPQATQKEWKLSMHKMEDWYALQGNSYQYPSWRDKIYTGFLDTRFCRYMYRVIRLDFGTLRNDRNKLVIDEVTKRFKYSLTLSLLPLMVTFILCQIFGLIMALNHNRFIDLSLNLLFLLLYALPVFVVAPFLIEKVALHHDFPWTQTPIPISGFHSANAIYLPQNSLGRLFDILQHIALPLLAILYGSLATQSRISRTAILEVLKKDYVRTGHAKGLSSFHITLFYVGRNAGITILTSIAGSLGVVLGGSLIIETIFGINGFGRFFYEAIINRDYNVILFSVMAGSFLTLLGYLISDICYTLLDPRVSLD